jgi:DNA-binding response OmpR family regulator
VAGLDDISRLLLSRGLIAEADLTRLRQGVASRSRFLGSLLAHGVPEPGIASVCAELLGMPGVDLSHTVIDLEVLQLVPRIVAESDLILPLSSEGARLHAAISAAEEDLRVLDEVHFITGREVSPYAAVPGPLEQTIAAAYDAKERGEKFWRGSAAAAEAAPAIGVVPPPAPPSVAPPEQVLLLTPEDMVAIDMVDLEVGDGDEADEEVLLSTKVRVGPRRILVVDDDPDILKLLQRALTASGYQVDTAADGREAEKKLAGPLPDLLLLDAMLPHVHGFEICGRIKASLRTRALPVIMISAIYRGWRFAQDARETYGADDYVEKPFHLPDLLRRIQTRLVEGTGQPAPQKDAAEKAYQEGMALLEAHRPLEARKPLELATRLDPFSVRAHFALARAMHEQGDVFFAISAYEKAVELRPNLFPALRALAELYLEKGFRRKAVETLERAALSAPDAPTRERVRAKLMRLL